MNLPNLGGGLILNHLNGSPWRTSFQLAIGLHVIILAAAVLSPTLFQRRAKLPEIYTVNLYTATEAQLEQPAASQDPSPPPSEVKTAPVKEKAVSIAQSKPAPAPEPAAPVRPISIKPLKRKIKIGKTEKEIASERIRLSQKLKSLQAKAAEEKAKEKADKAAREAISRLAESLKASQASRALQQSATRKTTAVASGPRGTGVEPDLIMKQYYSSVYQRIHQHWVLPNLPNWEESLEAILVITIRRDGTISKNFFESESENVYFNQFVLKAVKESSPLPPFPDQLAQDNLEIGLRFKPGELY